MLASRHRLPAAVSSNVRPRIKQYVLSTQYVLHSGPQAYAYENTEYDTVSYMFGPDLSFQYESMKAVVITKAVFKMHIPAMYFRNQSTSQQRGSKEKGY